MIYQDEAARVRIRVRLVRQGICRGGYMILGHGMPELGWCARVICRGGICYWGMACQS